MKDVYVITGATGGMGSDVAKNITKKGIVVLSDIDEKKLKKLKKELEDNKIKVEYKVCDVSNKEDVLSLAEFVSSLGKFKVMVHTAGVSGSMTNSKAILRINWLGTKFLMDAFYEIADKSIFINTASISGHLVPDSKLYNNSLLKPENFASFTLISALTNKDPNAAYAFSKKGVILLTENEVGKWAKKNSRIISISPGAIETPLAKLEAKENPSVDFMVDNSPISRYGQPEEFTSLVKYLISDDASFITGSDYIIDGGVTSHMKYNDIFGLKEHKVPTLGVSLSYLTTFLIVPFLLKLFLNDYEISNLPSSLLYFFNPAVIVLITGVLTKKKMNIQLIAIPFIIGLISSLILHQEWHIALALFYAIIAFFINIIALAILKQNEKES